jgi:hypothetical protein
MIEMKSLSGRSYVSGDLESQDQSPTSKFTTANNTPNTTTTMASITGNPITSVIGSKVSSNAVTNSVDSLIHIPSLVEKPKSYQQAQFANTMYAPPSTVNHNNIIQLTGEGSSTSSFGASSSGVHKLATDQPLPLPTGPGISSVMDPKYSSYPNTKYKTGQTVSESEKKLLVEFAFITFFFLNSFSAMMSAL